MPNFSEVAANALEEIIIRIKLTRTFTLPLSKGPVARSCASLCRRTGRMYIPRQQALALKMPAHESVPEIADHGAADRQHDHVDAVVVSAPPDHPAGPQHREDDRAPFQTGDGIGEGIHGASPMAVNFRPAGETHREMRHAKR